MRYLRFRIRTLLVAVLVIAVPLAWIAHQHNLLSRDEQVLTSFAEKFAIEIYIVGPHEGSVGVSVPQTGGGIAWRVVDAPNWIPRDAKRIRRFLFTRAGSVNFYDIDVSAEMFEVLADYDRLYTLSLEHCDADASDIEAFRTRRPDVYFVID